VHAIEATLNNPTLILAFLRNVQLVETLLNGSIN